MKKVKITLETENKEFDCNELHQFLTKARLLISMGCYERGKEVGLSYGKNKMKIKVEK